MTIIECFSESQQKLRDHLLAEQRRLQRAIRRAAADGRMDDVGTLQPQLDDVQGDLDLLDTEALAAAVAMRLDVLPQLPADFKDIVRRGQDDLASWQRLQQAVQRSIAVAGQVAEGVSTAARLVLKYGKYLA